MKKFKQLEVGNVYWTRGRKMMIRITGKDGRGWYRDDNGRWWDAEGHKSGGPKRVDLIWFDPSESLKGIWAHLTDEQVKAVMESNV